MKYYKTHSTQPRLETHDGQQYLVVPVVMAIAGEEMNGATISEDQLHAASWNGVPVTVGHPKDSSGNDISANSPDVLEQWAVGTIFNAHVDNGKLKAEAWVNTDKADEDLISRLQNMDQIDVSTGYFSDIQGNEYKDIKPDHLALLPNEQGACSYDDGCGVRSNQTKMSGKELLNNIKQFFSMDTDKISDELRMYLNEKGYRQIMRSLQSKLDDMDRSDATHYLVDVFEDDFIYKVESQSDTKYYRRSYSLNDDEEVIMGDQVRQVQKEINYNPVTNNGDTNMIDELISNDASPFSEDDREFLQNKDECAINSFAEKYLQDNDNGDAEEQDDEPETNASALSDEDKEALQVAREVANQEREKYIAHITANSAFDNETLEAKSTSELKELAANINPAPNYGGRPVGNQKANGSNNKEAVEAMSTPSTKDMIQNKRKAKEVN